MVENISVENGIKVGIFVIIETPFNEIMFYEELKKSNKGKLRLPGGNLENNDINLESAAKRKLMEEFKVEIHIESIFGYLDCNYDGEKYKNYLIKATLKTSNIKVQKEKNVSNPIWIKRQNIKDVENILPDILRAFEIYNKKFPLKSNNF